MDSGGVASLSKKKADGRITDGRRFPTAKLTATLKFQDISTAPNRHDPKSQVGGRLGNPMCRRSNR